MVTILTLIVIGVASWYGPGFEGQPTRIEEIYDSSALTFAANNLNGHDLPDGKSYLICTTTPVRAWWPHLGGWFVLDIDTTCVMSRWTDTGRFDEHGYVADLSRATFVELVGNDKVGLIEVRIYAVDTVRISCLGNRCNKPRWYYH